MSQIVSLGTAADLRGSQRKPRSQLKGRQPDALAAAEVQALLPVKPAEGHRHDLLIEYLHLLNDRYHGLFERHLVALAAEMRLSMAAVYEVATFYHHFAVLKDTDCAPTVTVRVCNGLACELAGARALFDELHASLHSASVHVVDAPCIGRCEQAPAAVVQQLPVACATASKVKVLAQSIIAKDITGVVSYPYNNDAINYVTIGYTAYRANGGYALAAAVVNGEDDADELIAAVEASGLRGLGGAGFATARKWRIVREQSAPRYLAVNIDEGEPGTFKDRTYLERDPHRFLEGMLIAAQIVGADSCTIYLRDEYHHCRVTLAHELALLQADPPCPLPRIELRRGAGAYICGEESAMLESIEGKRGLPRLRPPYIAHVGLFGRPTLEHNFETLYWIRDIVQKGAAWYGSFGRNGRSGLRSFSVSGRVKLPGVKLAPAGISVRELIDEYCGGMADGHTLYAYLPGGASGGILPARLDHISLDFDTLQPYGCFIGSAGVMVLSQHDRARDAALNVMRFFEAESCGQCTPCRVGTAKAAALMQAPVWDSATLEDLAQVMADASICGLGQAAPNPIRCVQTYFAEELL